MKDTIKKLLSGVLIGGLLASNIPFVKAIELNETNSTTGDVMVGRVDTTLYNVDIDFRYFGQFDWIYSNQDKKYNWSETSIKEATYHTGDELPPARLCTTSSMNEEKTEWHDGDKYYYSINNKISITDTSENGYINASMEFVPEENYTWTGMKIARAELSCSEVEKGDREKTTLYKDSTCNQLFASSDTTDENTKYYSLDSTSVTSNYFPKDAGEGYTWSNLEFWESGRKYDWNYDGQSNWRITDKRYSEIYPELYITDEENIITPKSGDKIGTVTIEITPGN